MIAFSATPTTGLDAGGIVRSYLMCQNPVGRARIYVMDDNGNDLRCLTSSGPLANCTEPIWSPDGKELAFRVEDTSGIYLIDVDGTNLRQLRMQDTSPRTLLMKDWLADGRILLQAVDASQPITYATLVDFYTINPDGTRLQYLASTEAFAGRTLNA